MDTLEAILSNNTVTIFQHVRRKGDNLAESITNHGVTKQGAIQQVKWEELLDLNGKERWKMISTQGFVDSNIEEKGNEHGCQEGRRTHGGPLPADVSSEQD